mgnify:CR=1 FL=1
MTLEKKIEDIIDAHCDFPNYSYFQTRLGKCGEEGLEEMVAELLDLFYKESKQL